jgi:osmotically-inducible protein OsmY
LEAKGLGEVKAFVAKDGTATLSGTVSSAEQKEQALAFARDDKAIKSVADGIELRIAATDLEQAVNKALASGGLAGVSAKVGDDLSARLGGTASDPAEKEKAIAIAKAVPNVRAVQDQIELVPVPPPPAVAAITPPVVAPSRAFQDLLPTPPSAPAVSAASVQRSVDAALRREGLQGVGSRVESDLTVTLFGSVDNAEARLRAGRVAASQPNVSGIRNNIQVVATAPVPSPRAAIAPPAPGPGVVDPAKLEGEINRALRGRDVRGITAQVGDDLTVTLKGSTNAGDKDRAFQIARSFKDVRTLRDQVFVVE